MSKAVKLPNNVVSELEEIKQKLGLKSLGEAADFLFSFSSSPISILALLLDLRGDVKSLVDKLDRLNENIERLLESLEELTK